MLHFSRKHLVKEEYISRKKINKTLELIFREGPLKDLFSLKMGFRKDCGISQRSGPQKHLSSKICPKNRCFSKKGCLKEPRTTFKKRTSPKGLFPKKCGQKEICAQESVKEIVVSLRVADVPQRRKSHKIMSSAGYVISCRKGE